MDTLSGCLTHFETLSDPRQQAKVLYPLNELLLLALCDTFADMVIYGQNKLAVSSTASSCSARHSLARYTWSCL